MKSVLIVGHGIEGWLTAVRLARAVAAHDVHISVVPVSGATDWDNLYAVHPLEPNDTLRAAGISDLALVQQCEASFGLGSLWSDGALIPYGPVGAALGGIAFAQCWREHTDAPTAHDFLRYSPAAVALRGNVFAPPVARNAIGTLQHEIARHVDPATLLDLLRSAALSLGVKQSSSALAAAQALDHAAPINHLALATGERVSADLYIDASGPANALTSARPPHSWSGTNGAAGWHVETQRTPRENVLRPAVIIHEQHQHWRIDVPLAGSMLQLGFRPADRDAELTPGFVPSPWHHNTIAVGHAASRLVPLAPLPIRLLNQSLVNLVRLFPGAHGMQAEANEFNHLYARDAAEVHDLANWLRDGHADHTSETHKARHALFAKRGWLMPSDGAVVSHADWLNAFIGRGVVPRAADPMAARLPAQQAQRHMAELERNIARVVGEFPPLDHYLAAARATPAKIAAGGAT